MSGGIVPAMRTDLLSAEEAAERLGVTRRTITRWAANGRLPVAFQVPTGETGARFFAPEDVDALSEQATA